MFKNRWVVGLIVAVAGAASGAWALEMKPDALELNDVAQFATNLGDLSGGSYIFKDLSIHSPEDIDLFTWTPKEGPEDTD